MGLIVNRSEINLIRCVYNTQEQKVVSYRCEPESPNVLPKYIELRDGMYYKIDKGGVVDKDSTAFSKKLDKATNDYKMVIHKECNHREVTVAVTNPTPARSKENE